MLDMYREDTEPFVLIAACGQPASVYSEDMEVIDCKQCKQTEEYRELEEL